MVRSPSWNQIGGIRRALGMGYLRRMGGMGPPRGKPHRHPVGNGMSLYAAHARTGSPPRIFTRFLRRPVARFDARKPEVHERDDVFPPTHRDSEPGLALAGTGMSRSPGCRLCSLMNRQSTNATKFTVRSAYGRLADYRSTVGILSSRRAIVTVL